MEHGPFIDDKNDDLAIKKMVISQFAPLNYQRVIGI